MKETVLYIVIVLSLLFVVTKCYDTIREEKRANDCKEILSKTRTISEEQSIVLFNKCLTSKE